MFMVPLSSPCLPGVPGAVLSSVPAGFSFSTPFSRSALLVLPVVAATSAKNKPTVDVLWDEMEGVYEGNMIVS